MGLFSSKNKSGRQLSRKENRAGAETSLIGARISVQGKVTGGGSLIVMGKIEGEIDLAGELVVSPPAGVRGEIRAQAIAVAGTIEGKVSAREKIHLEKSAVVSGEIHAGRISIADGAHLNGSVVMKQEPGRKES